MIKIDYDYNFSPEFKQALDNLAITANSFAKSLEPFKEQQAIIQEAINKTSLFTSVGQISNSIAPLIVTSNEYNELLRTITSTIPKINPDINRQIVELGSVMSLAISSGYFGNETNSEQEMNDLLDKEIQDSVGTEVVSKIHEEYQETPDDESNNGNPTDEQDDIAEHNDLRSDLVSKEWHARIWIEAIYKYVVNTLILYTAGAISEIELQKILEAISKYIDSWQ